MPTEQVLLGLVNPTTSRTPPDSSDSEDMLQPKSRLFYALDAISDRVSVVDKDKTIVFVNKVLRQSLGDIV